MTSRHTDARRRCVPLISCIFNKEEYIDMLSAKFSFDKTIASNTYDVWYSKQVFLPE